MAYKKMWVQVIQPVVDDDYGDNDETDNHHYESWVAFLQGFLSINPSGRVKRGNFSFWE